jgi:hypothetical protein
VIRNETKMTLGHLLECQQIMKAFEEVIRHSTFHLIRRGPPLRNFKKILNRHSKFIVLVSSMEVLQFNKHLLNFLCHG